MSQLLQETVIRDIVDVLTDFKDADEVQAILNRKNGKSFSSIAKASSKLTLIFPVIVSRSVSIDTITMISKAIERKAATMLQMLFSSMSVTNADNAIDYIKNFHTNLKIDSNMSVDSFVDAMDKFVVNAESFTWKEKEAVQQILSELKNIYNEPPSSISEMGLNNYVVKNDPYTGEYYLEQKVVQEAKSGHKSGRRITTHRPHNNAPTINVNPPTINVNTNGNGIPLATFRTNNNSSNNNNGTTSSLDINISNNGNGGGGGIGSNNISTNDFKNAVQGLTYSQQLHSNMLMDTDVKKCNELVPTMMSIACYQVKDDKTIPLNFVLGVKAKIYPLDSSDILKRLAMKHSDGNGLLNFVRATTSEIAFWKDFVFAIDRAKSDAKAQSRKGSSSEIWKLLERRALKSKIRRNFSMVNDAPSITTLVITDEEAEYLKKSDGIDIKNPRVIRPIMEAYNLMGFVIANESMEVANFIFDTGDDIYEQIAFNALEREASDNSYKKMVNLISKINR